VTDTVEYSIPLHTKRVTFKTVLSDNRLHWYHIITYSYKNWSTDGNEYNDYNSYTALTNNSKHKNANIETN